MNSQPPVTGEITSMRSPAWSAWAAYCVLGTNWVFTATAKGGERGRQALADVNDYISGINAYITRAISARNFPGEYVLTGHADAITNWNDIQPFKVTDMVAIASVVGGLFGAGGGGEVQSALVKLAAQNRYGAAGAPWATTPGISSATVR